MGSTKATCVKWGVEKQFRGRLGDLEGGCEGCVRGTLDNGQAAGLRWEGIMEVVKGGDGVEEHHTQGKHIGGCQAKGAHPYELELGQHLLVGRCWGSPHHQRYAGQQQTFGLIGQGPYRCVDGACHIGDPAALQAQFEDLELVTVH
jgi:hypothetical protein